MSTIRATMTRRLLGEASGPLTGIYLITHRASGKRYVGQSVNIRGRWAEHRSSNGSKLAAALKKHGPDAFTFEIVEPCPREELNDREAFYVWAFDCVSPKGYNLTTGGGQALKFSEEARAKLSQSLRNSEALKVGVRRREDDPEKQARRLAAVREAVAAPEVRARLSASLRNSEALKAARARLRADPNYQARNRDQLARLNADPAILEGRRDQLARLHADPEATARRIEAQRRVQADPTIYTIVNVKTGERDTGTRLDFRDRHRMRLEMLADLVNGKCKTHLGWRLARPEEKQ